MIIFHNFMIYLNISQKGIIYIYDQNTYDLSRLSKPINMNTDWARMLSLNVQV